MKFFVAFSMFLVAATCLPQHFYPRYRPGFRPKRQNDQISDKVNTLNDPELYPQVPADQLGPHLEEPGVQEGFPDLPEKIDAQKKPEVPEEDSVEDEKDDGNIFALFRPGNSRNQGSVSFFPIVFGGSGGAGRTAGNPGGIAIANSFSTGRRGVANSNAFSGNPEAFRNFRRGEEN